MTTTIDNDMDWSPFDVLDTPSTGATDTISRQGSTMLTAFCNLRGDPLLLSHALSPSPLLWASTPAMSPIVQSLHSDSNSYVTTDSATDPFSTVATPDVVGSSHSSTIDSPLDHAESGVSTPISIQTRPHLHDGQEDGHGQEVPIVTKVRIDSDQLAFVNTGTCRHEFDGESWRLTYTKLKDGTYSMSVRVPIVVSATGAAPIDLEWKAVLLPITKPVNRVDVAHVKAMVDECDLGALMGTNAAFSGILTHTSDRKLALSMEFSIAIRKQYFLAIVVNGIGVAGAPNVIKVHGDRNKRTRGGTKRKAPAREHEDEVHDSPVSSSAAAKRLKVDDSESEAEQSASSSSTSVAMCPLPPPSPVFGSHIHSQGTLYNAIEMTDRCTPMILQLLKDHSFLAADIQVAASLLFNLHVRGNSSLWTPANIVDTLALLGEHADVIRQRAWSTPTACPDLMHAIAHCTRSDIVDALFKYLHPYSVRAPASAPCSHSCYVGHKQMTCEVCRAFATRSALSLANSSGYFPIHVAAWGRNTAFVAHHLRIKGAEATFLAINQRDGGNFFHATCASLSAVDWLEELWQKVIVENSDRLVAAQALLRKDQRGRSPMDMAAFQLKNRHDTPCHAKRRTYQWVTDTLALLPSA